MYYNIWSNTIEFLHCQLKCVCARIVIASVTEPWHRRVSVWLCETWLFKRKEYFCKLLVLINYKVNSTMGIHTQKSFRSSVQVKRFGRVWIPTGRGIESTRAWSTNLSKSKNGFIWLKSLLISTTRGMAHTSRTMNYNAPFSFMVTFFSPTRMTSIGRNRSKDGAVRIKPAKNCFFSIHPGASRKSPKSTIYTYLVYHSEFVVFSSSSLFVWVC